MKLSMKFYRYDIVLSFYLFMNIQFLLFYMMFYIDVHVTYSIYPFMYTNLFKMESIVLPIKSSVAYNEENIKMLYFTNFQLAIYTLRKVMKIIAFLRKFLVILPQNVSTVFYPT